MIYNFHVFECHYYPRNFEFSKKKIIQVSMEDFFPLYRPQTQKAALDAGMDWYNTSYM